MHCYRLALNKFLHHLPNTESQVSRERINNRQKMCPNQSQASSPTRLLGVYVFTGCKVISGWLPTWVSAHSWQLYSAAPLGNYATGTLTQYPTQSHYPDTELTSPCPIPLMQSAGLGNDKY